MKTHVVARITIAAGPAEVFKYLGHLKYHHLWNPHLQEVSLLKTLKPGMTYKSISMMFGVRITGKNVVTKITPNEELEIENNTGTLRYSVNYRLQADHKTTHVICTTNITPESSAFAFAAPILKPLARRELQSDLHALKTVVEHHIV